MKSSPQSVWNPARLDVRAFAQAGQTIQGPSAIKDFERLLAETVPDAAEVGPVEWRLHGEFRPDPGGLDVPWLHLEATASVPLPCQRCLGSVTIKLLVDRWFRFVADEAAAELEDEDSEEDVLALEPRPDILALLEDELLMALPLVPMHGECPVAVPMQAGEIEGGETPTPRESPFAQLAKLKR